MLLAPFSAHAQEKSHVTSAQVDNAIREVEKLAQKQIQEPYGKGDAASANSVFALRLIRERVAIIVFHWEGLVFRALHNYQSFILSRSEVARQRVRLAD
jgi:hypothetical protein